MATPGERPGVTEANGQTGAAVASQPKNTKTGQTTPAPASPLDGPDFLLRRMDGESPLQANVPYADPDETAEWGALLGDDPFAPAMGSARTDDWSARDIPSRSANRPPPPVSAPRHGNRSSAAMALAETQTAVATLPRPEPFYPTNETTAERQAVVLAALLDEEADLRGLDP